LAGTCSALQAPADWLPLEQVERCAALLADVRWPDGALRALRAARKAGIPAILDAEVAAAETLETLTRAADHVIFSERGLEAYSRHDSRPGGRSGAPSRGEVEAFLASRR
jgi:sugar/nucleoside kinase (ribokinase family)